MTLEKSDHFTESIDEPLRALENARRARNVALSRFRTLGFGESGAAGVVGLDGDKIASLEIRSWIYNGGLFGRSIRRACSRAAPADMKVLLSENAANRLSAWANVPFLVY
jgi:hypothetical protein